MNTIEEIKHRNKATSTIFSASSIRITIDKFAEEKMNSSLQGLKEEGITIVQKIGGEEDIPVAAASILAKNIFEEEVEKMSQRHRINFSTIQPSDVPKDILRQIAKMHFKNVQYNPATNINKNNG
jgi:ribonuclease HIII